jgi:hypothetical protein
MDGDVGSEADDGYINLPSRRLSCLLILARIFSLSKKCQPTEAWCAASSSALFENWCFGLAHGLGAVLRVSGDIFENDFDWRR